MLMTKQIDGIEKQFFLVQNDADEIVELMQEEVLFIKSIDDSDDGLAIFHTANAKYSAIHTENASRNLAAYLGVNFTENPQNK